MELLGHTDVVSEVAFAPSGNHLVSGSWDHNCRYCVSCVTITRVLHALQRVRLDAYVCRRAWPHRTPRPRGGLQQGQ